MTEKRSMSERYEQAQQMKDQQYRRLFVYTKKTMDEMVKILWEAYKAKHKRRGRHRKLAVEEMLMMACKYWREYVTYLSLSHEYGIAESSAHDIVVWLENVLIKSGTYALPGKKTAERRQNRSYFGRCNGNTGGTAKTRTKKMVFREEEAAHHQNTNRDVCKDQNNSRGIC